MKITNAPKKRLTLGLSALVLLLAFSFGVLTVQTSAQTQFSPEAKSTFCKEGSGTKDEPCVNPDVEKISQNAQAKSPDKIKCPNQADCGGIITQIVNPLIKLVTAVIGVILAISMVLAGITYSSAGGDPGKVAAAKKRMTNTVIALVMYIFMFGLLQWLVPGGLV